MNAREVAEAALGTAGIWLIVSRIPDFGLNVALWPVGPDGVLHWVGVIHFMLWLGCGLALILFRRPVASWLVPASPSELTAPVAGLQAAAFSVVGLVLLAHGLADLLGRLAMSVTYPGRMTLEWLAAALAEIAIGLAVFLGARGLVRLWHAIRRR